MTIRIAGDRLRQARLAAGLSLRGLADHTGLTTAITRRLEDGDTRILRAVSIAELITAADTLALTPAALFTTDPTDGGPHRDNADRSDGQVQRDARQLAALLTGRTVDTSRRALYTALGWDLQRLRSAREHLNTTLHPAGLTVREVNDGWRLVPLDDDQAANRTQLPTANQTETNGLDTPTLRLLHGITHSGDTSKTGARSKGRLTRLATLDVIGAITHVGGQPTPSAALRVALMLDDPQVTA